MSTATPPNKSQSLHALDALNFFAADVQTGLGPFLAAYLTINHWQPGPIGLALALSTLATVLTQTPAGLLVDKAPFKRLLLILACSLIAIASATMFLSVAPPAVYIGQILIGIAAAIFPPTVAAITLGLVDHKGLEPRVGRNETFNHAGNVVAALAMGYIGVHAPAHMFTFVIALAILTVISTLLMRSKDINTNLARGAADNPKEKSQVQPIKKILTNRPIICFAIAVILFHIANAAMLPTAGELMAKQDPKHAAGYMSACIIAAQLVMVPVAFWAGRAATKGRRRVLLIGFAALPLRGLLYTFSSDPRYIVAVQLLDGIGAAVIGVMGTIIIADLTRNTGRFNFTQGLLATATGIGASLSVLLTGLLVQHAGYSTGFLTLATLAAAAWLFLFFFVQESKTQTHPNPSPPPKPNPTLQPA